LVGSFLERFVHTKSSHCSASRGRHDYGCIRVPCSPVYGRFLPRQSRRIYDSGPLCGKCLLLCTGIKLLTTVYPALDIQWPRVVHGLFALALPHPPFRGTGHRRWGPPIFGHHHGRCPQSGSVSTLVVGGVLAIHVFLMYVQSQRISPSDTCRRHDRDSWVSGQDL